MVIARLDHGRVQIVDRIREPVRLAGGLQPDGTLSDKAQARALDALRLFGQRTKDFGAGQVRIVGTNTLRSAKNARQFVEQAEEALGHSIDVIAGREEARLIYLGVSHGVAGAPARRLVVDIGGGSTECIIGDKFKARAVHSLYMGCVAYTREFFKDGKISASRMDAAELAASLELNPVSARLLGYGWERAIGASGTVKAARDILLANEWTGEQITLQGLKRLRKALIDAGRADKINLNGLETDRRPVIAGGVAILIAVFRQLKLKEMWVSPTALREGLLYDMVGRLKHEDPRDRTIAELCARYSVDLAHAERVQEMALGLLSHAADSWKLRGEHPAHVLRWGAQLHEIGLAVNFTGHHKHGAYLVAESDLPGFSKNEQALVSAVLRGHRRKIRQEYFAAVSSSERTLAVRLCVLLRLAVLLTRSRFVEPVPVPDLAVDGEQLRLRFAEDWLETHPLVEADLERESRLLKSIEVELQVSRTAS